MNRYHFCAEQNGCHQAGSDQSRKQMWHALPGMGTCHDTAKLFPRPGAAIEFHMGRSSTIPRTIWETTTDANHDGCIAHLVLFGFADSRIDTQISFNIGQFSYPYQCHPHRSGSVFNNIFCTTATSVSPSTSAG